MRTKMKKSRINTIRNGKDLNGFKLSLQKDGVTFRKGETTAYDNVGQPPLSDLRPGHEYTALCSTTPEEREIAGKGELAFCIHLSTHATIEEAAYAAWIFNQDREANLIALKDIGHNCYDCGPIPAIISAIDTEEHNAYRAGMRAKRIASVNRRAAIKAGKTPSKAAIKFSEEDNRMIDTKGGRTIMSRKYGSKVFINLGWKYGNHTVIRDIQNLTITEFETRYGIQSKADIPKVA